MSKETKFHVESLEIESGVIFKLVAPDGDVVGSFADEVAAQAMADALNGEDVEGEEPEADEA